MRSYEQIIHYVGEQLANGKAPRIVVREIVAFGMEPQQAATLVTTIASRSNLAMFRWKRGLKFIGVAVCLMLLYGVVVLVTRFAGEFPGTHIVTKGLVVLACLATIYGILWFVGWYLAARGQGSQQ